MTDEGLGLPPLPPGLPALSDEIAFDPAWLETPRHIHFIGIGGAGMSAIATVLVAMGHRVSGSDMKDSTTLARLASLGVGTAVGHGAANLAGAEAVVFSSAVRDSNPEMRAAVEAGLPRFRRSQLLAALTSMRKAMVVVGTHGKTTTTSLLALMLRSGGLDPSFLIGGDVNEAGTNAHWGNGEYLIAEGDESDGTFLTLDADGGVVTGVEADHLENWGDSLEALEAGFARFIAGVSGPVVVCSDDPGGMRASGAARRDVITYGETSEADYRLDVISTERQGCRFAVWHGETRVIEALLPQPGRHFALNATGAAVLALSLGLPSDEISRAIRHFGGVDRRFQFRGEGRGVLVYDDYAHLPAEVAATVAAAGEIAAGRVVAVFQPHLYSRTRQFSTEFAESLSRADVVVLTDVFGAREEPVPGVSSKLIAEALASMAGAREVIYVPRRGEIAAEIAPLAVEGDVIVTMGAGDITATGPEILLELRGSG